MNCERSLRLTICISRRSVLVDGFMYGTPTWTWSAAVEDALCVRTFEPVDGPIDGAYRAKYKSSAYLSPMISARAPAAIIKIMPR